MQELDGSSHAATGSAAEEVFACSDCSRELRGIYFEVDGRPVCEACRYRVGEGDEEESRWRRLGRALGLGAAGGVVGAALYYAVLALTGYEVGLLAIVVGFLVGGGVRLGSRRRGGWLYRSMAVVMTYGAIVSTYVPMILQEVGGFDEAVEELATPASQGEEPAAAAGEEPGTAALAASVGTQAPATPHEAPAADAEALEVALSEAGGGLVLRQEGDSVSVAPFGVAGWLVGGLLIAVFAAALPFLAAVESPAGLLIIGVALFEAWRLNRRHVVEIAGPFGVGERPAPAAAD
ncbi:MAG TPA: hypothetical protein VMT16_08005 [Thermoanaerobaculia bacterium]|nr:hypothetical protein [Thermoanaerobaculia bacterium]